MERKAPVPRRIVQLILILGLLLSTPTQARAEAIWGWSPGVKLSWTFGYGLTYGFEVSFIRLPDLSSDESNIFYRALDSFGQFCSETWGIVVNIDTTFRGLFRTRVGAEWVGPGIGLEAGPALVVDKHGTHLGLGITPWLGYHFYGFYTFTWVFGKSPNHHELGMYAKAPLLGFGGGSTYGDDDDWD